MPDTDPTPTEPTEPQGDPSDLGEGGKKALAAERNRAAAAEKQNKLLEAQIAALQTAASQQTEGLAKALGLKPEESDVTRLAEQVGQLQKQFTETQRQNVVLTAATEHGISDPEDLQLLADAKDEDAIRRLAARIAKGNEGGTSPTKPKPDLTQGRASGPAARTPGDEFADFLKRQLS